MDTLPGLLEDVRTGNITAEAACARLDDETARHYGARSRDAGVVYTPLPVARYICRQAIGSYQASGQPLENIRVFDSSCGSGIFLQAALEELYRLRAEKSGLNEHELKRHIIENCLFGMDIDLYSAEAASLRLKMLIPQSGENQMKVNVSCDNALFSTGVGAFDLIVGNPPYMRIKSMSGVMKNDIPLKVKESHFYRYQEGNLNLYKLFIERNLGFLKAEGSMGLIIPSSFLNEATSEKLRKHIFMTCSMEEIVEIPERSRIFPGVNQATAIILLKKSKALHGSLRLRLGASGESLETGNSSVMIAYDELAAFTDGRMEVPLLTDPAVEWEMMRRLKGIPPFRGGNGVPPVGEISVGNVDETFDKAYISEEWTGDIFVKGIHLKEYFVDLSPGGRQPRWVKKSEFLHKRSTVASTIAKWRIIGRNTQNKACSRRLKFAILPPGYLCSNSIKQIVITDPCIDPHYLLGLLNASILNWYFELFCSQNNIRNYRIEALPIVRAPGSIQSTFAHVARMIMSSTGENRQYYDKLMDAMAFELYFGGPGLIASAASPQGFNTTTIRELIDAVTSDRRYDIVDNATYKRQEGRK
jgi:Alw26I/Eco31I/Esp3I family type II restriction m6 adenine DNA methyltransferase